MIKEPNLGKMQDHSKLEKKQEIRKEIMFQDQGPTKIVQTMSRIELEM